MPKNKTTKLVNEAAGISIDLTNPIVTNAIAGIINSAFETGLNPAWFEVKSLNKFGFLDAAFASQTPIDGKMCGGMATPSGKPVRLDWMIECRLNADQVDEKSDADSPWDQLTPYGVIFNWTRFAKDYNNSAYGREVVMSYLRYIQAISNGDYRLAEEIWDNAEPDGVTDDGVTQIAIGGDWIYG
jgi:hypothetical protein